MKVNLGCGRNPLDGYVNLDRMPLPGVDLVFDLDQPDKLTLPFDEGSVSEWLAIDLVEHIVNFLPMFEELWRCSAPGADFLTALPYGTSDDAWEDPTHVRPWYLGSWGYLGQPWYHRADYGYRGDWEVERIVLDVADSPATLEELMGEIQHLRNVVERQHVHLKAVKPARPCDQSLMRPPPVEVRKLREA